MPTKRKSLKRKSNSGPIGIVAVAIVALGAGALLFRRSVAPERYAAPPPPVSGNAPIGAILPEAVPTPDSTGRQARGEAIVYRVATDSNGSHLQQIRVKIDDGGSDAGISTIDALNAMADAKDSPLPPGTRANSYHINDGGIATVDFNAALTKNFPGGDEAEALAINAILATVGQFGAREVQITVEGKKVDSLGGTQSLMSPLPVPQTVKQTAQGAGKS